MNITVTLTAAESALLQKQADENNLQPNRKIPSTPESVVLDVLIQAASELLAAMGDKFSTADRQSVIAALADPEKLATAKAALRL